MSLNRLLNYELEIRDLDCYNKTGNKLPKFLFGISSSVSSAVTHKSELWTHSYLQEHYFAQKPSPRKSRKSIASFGLREGSFIGIQVQLHGFKGYEMQDVWLYVIAPQVLNIRKTDIWNLSTFSECPLFPVQFYSLHNLQGGSLYFHNKPLDDIY